LKKTSLTGFIFLSIIYLQVCLISIFTHTLPSEIEFSVLNNMTLFTDLFQINPGTALHYFFIDREVILIQKYDQSTSSQVWGLYLMPISIITQLIVSIIITAAMQHSPPRRITLLSVVSCFILLFAVFYLRLQACCTSQPAWLPEILLLSQSYKPLSDTVFWQNLYIEVQPHLAFIQYLLYALSILTLAVSLHRITVNNCHKPS